MSNNNNEQVLPFNVALAQDAGEPMNIDSERQGNNQEQNSRVAPIPESVSGETSTSQTPAASASEKEQAGLTEKQVRQIFSPLDQPGAPTPITGLYVEGTDLQGDFEEAVLVAKRRMLAVSIELSKNQVSSNRDQVTRIRANVADAQMHLES